MALCVYYLSIGDIFNDLDLANFSHLPLPFNLHYHLEPIEFLSKSLTQTVRAIRWSKTIAEKFNPLRRVRQRCNDRKQTDRQL